MKATPGRVRILTALAKDGAYARPNRSIPGEIHRMTVDMELIFRRSGYIEEARVGLGYAWTITQKGRDWLRAARLARQTT